MRLPRRSALLVFLTVAAPGCYLAHERPARDAGVDAARPDAFALSDGGRDAGSDGGHDVGTDAFVFPDTGVAPVCPVVPHYCDAIPDVVVHLEHVVPYFMPRSDACVTVDVPPIEDTCAFPQRRVRVIRCAGDPELDHVEAAVEITSVGPATARFWGVTDVPYDHCGCSGVPTGVVSTRPVVGLGTSVPIGPEAYGGRDYLLWGRDVGYRMTACAVEGPHF